MGFSLHAGRGFWLARDPAAAGLVTTHIMIRYKGQERPAERGSKGTGQVRSKVKSKGGAAEGLPGELPLNSRGRGTVIGLPAAWLAWQSRAAADISDFWVLSIGLLLVLTYR